MACCLSARFVALLLAFCICLSAAFVPLAVSSSRPNHNKNAFAVATAATSSRRTATALFMAGAATTIEREQTTITKGPPSILERPPAVERRRHAEEQEVPSKQRRKQGSEAWEVRIYNDGLNTREHVARSLVQVTGLSEWQAYQTMMQAHQNGMAAVGRWVYEVAEMYHDALKKKGIVCDIVPVDEE